MTAPEHAGSTNVGVTFGGPDGPGEEKGETMAMLVASATAEDWAGTTIAIATSSTSDRSNYLLDLASIRWPDYLG